MIPVMVAVLVAAPQAGRAQEPDRPSEIEIVGRLTAEGVECPLIRDAHGAGYTLVGDLGAARPGDRLCLRGRLVAFSYCMQGPTVAVSEVLPAEACAQ